MGIGDVWTPGAQVAQVATGLDVRLCGGRTVVCWENVQQVQAEDRVLNRHAFTTRAEATAAVSTWTETVYNRRLRLSALSGIGSIVVETRTISTALEAAYPMSTKRVNPRSRNSTYARASSDALKTAITLGGLGCRSMSSLHADGRILYASQRITKFAAQNAITRSGRTWVGIRPWLNHSS